jgi:hypothetical protein
MVPIKSINANYGINVPTNRNEITPELLEKLTKHIHLAKNYAIVALLNKVKLWDLAASSGVVNAKGGGKDVVSSVIVLLAKANGELPGKIGDKVCIARTDLELGLHINGISAISVEGFRNYIASDDALCKSVVSRTAFADTEYIYLLEFKIIGFNSIKAIIDTEANSVNDDPFVILKDAR